MENRLLRHMAKVGVGSRGAKHLSRAEAVEAMNALLDGAYHPVTFGAFLLAERFKPETAEELAGFADAMAERLVYPADPNPVDGLINGSGAYDGKERTLNLGVVSALAAAGAGARILLHGSRGIPAKRGCTPSHVLEQLGIDYARSPDQAKLDIETNGLGYLHQPVANPQFHKLLENRLRVGKRTLLNTIEPLANPLGAQTHVGGFFHRPFAELVCETIAQSERLGFKRAVMVAGVEGSDEIRPGRSMIAEWREGGINTYYLSPGELDCPADEADIAAPEGSSPEEIARAGAERLLECLEGKAPRGFANLVTVNAAVRLYAGGLAETVEAGIPMARESLASGAAQSVLDRWRERAAPAG